MTRPRGDNEPSTYHESPTIPSELKRRFDLLKAVLGNRMTISEAAREAGIARVNMQSLVHRTEAAVLSAITPRPTGPAPKSNTEKELTARMKELERQNARLTEQLQAADDMMAAAGEIIRSLRGLPPMPKSSGSRSPATTTPSQRSGRRSPKASRSSTRRNSPPTSSSSSSPETEDPDPDPDPLGAASTSSRASTASSTTTNSMSAESTPSSFESVLTHVLQRVASSAASTIQCASALGVTPSTLRRWLTRVVAGEPIMRRRGGVRAAVSADAEASVRELVKIMHGLVGAAALAHSIEGVSRRTAAAIKQDTLREIERDRKRQTHHVGVMVIGALRGFDAMHVANGLLLSAGDATIPYRTTIRHTARYDERSVADLLDEDFALHGAPLVLRCDRARCHTAPDVMSVLERHGVLLLQGPPRYPQYYGQLERQNLEHRQWLGDQLVVDQPTLDVMKHALNAVWRRPTLNWATAQERWAERHPLDDEREALHDDVMQRARRLRAHVSDDLAMRLATEQALTERGLLKVTAGR